MINIVLLEPEQGGNVGNIGRTCLAIGAKLHLIEPLGFRLTDREIKRAGMDYWHKVDVTRYDNYEDFLEKNPGAVVYMATTKSKTVYTEVIPEEILMENRERCVRIPMLPDIRSLNLANSVAIVAYEAMRQQEFKQFQLQGQLHHHEW